MSLLFKNFRIFEGKQFIEPTDLIVDGDTIVKVGSELSGDFDVVYDGDDKQILSPGLIDIHAHFRDPGGEWNEDLDSGSHAGAAGGFTTLVAMPNTTPAVSEASLVEYVLRHGEAANAARILPSGCVSKDRAGIDMADLYLMADAGAVFFTDDGSPISTSNLMRLALLYVGKRLPRIMEHPEDVSLFRGGQVHEGKVSAISGLKGIPAASEEIDVARGIALARETGGRIHFTHLSSRGAIGLVKQAKKEGLDVTCDTTFHHLTLNENAIIDSGYNSVYKVNPPLRSEDDQVALWNGISDGTIDAIVTDHAPWCSDRKDVPFQDSPFGIASLECAVAVLLDYRAKNYSEVPIEKLLHLMTDSPAMLLPKKWNKLGRIVEGGIADITIIDENRTRRVDCNSWYSKARNCPWHDAVFSAWPVATFVEGRKIWEDR